MANAELTTDDFLFVDVMVSGESLKDDDQYFDATEDANALSSMDSGTVPTVDVELASHEVDYSALDIGFYL